MLRAVVAIVSDVRCIEYSATGHPERPERIAATMTRLQTQTDLELAWTEVATFEDKLILRAHTSDHLRAIDSAAAEFDADTPAYPAIGAHARRSVGGALQAMRTALAGTPAFSLIRPPGHHATADRAMGFCYLNAVAIAALEARAAGIERVAVFDFDVHHGNGTEAILLNRPGIMFFSIHQSPCYPGTGLANVGRNCFNFPVPPRTARAEYRRVLETALAALRKFDPQLVAVSAGFDAYARDPLAEETLEREDFHWLGQQMRALDIPLFSVLEGGYSDDLPDLILAYLSGWDGG